MSVKKEEAYKLGVGQTRFRKKFRRKQRMKKFKSFLLWTSCTALTAAAVFSVGFHVSAASDAGMSGYINEGETVLSNKMSFLIREPYRGEVVTCRVNIGGTDHILNRRVIAFAGETVEIRDGVLYIDGNPCEESYVSMGTNSDIASYTVPPGCYYVLSDNRNAGPDSRDGIYIDRSDIIGSALEGLSVDDIFTDLEYIRTTVIGMVQGIS